jgi:tRNA(Ile)-lysidine synthase TilS/MesJ
MLGENAGGTTVKLAGNLAASPARSYKVNFEILPYPVMHPFRTRRLPAAMLKTGQSCKQCLMPAAAPEAQIDASGLCQFCRADPRAAEERAEGQRRVYEQDLEQAIAQARARRGTAGVVCLSGGKDSILLLYKLKVELGLDVVAFTTDMNIPDIAWDNMRRTMDRLRVEHVVHKPDQAFYDKMYRFLLQNQEERGAVRTVCYVCAPIFEADALRYATERGIPFVFAGYSPGQPAPERMTYEFPLAAVAETDWTPRSMRESGLFDERELAHFWNPKRYPAGTAFPRYIAPFHAWPYSQEEAIKKVVALGLVSSPKNASPIHSNCPLNWLLMYSDLKNLGYNPYAPEFAGLVRSGKANRTYWRIAQPIVNFMIRHQVMLGREVKRSFARLGLKPDQLKINRPADRDSELTRRVKTRPSS